MSFEAELKEYARTIGLDLIGITTAEPFFEAHARMVKMRQAGYFSLWAEQDLQKRCNPQVLMEDAATIIAAGIFLPPRDCGISGQSFYGKLARFAQYQDYHSYLHTKLDQLVSFIRQKYPDIKTAIYIDTGPLSDREIAYRAGLGFIGKNSALIHPDYGSFIALGEILLNIPLLPDQPLENGCGDCQLCIKSCPQNAIKAPGEIAAQECLSYFTQEKGLPPENIRKKLQGRLWGCDTCQDVCPYNRKIQQQHSLLKTHELGVEVDLAEILMMTNRDYQKKVGNTALAWRGKTTLQRNAIINLGNSRNPATLPLLATALHDSRKLIRRTAIWAIGQIGGTKAYELLQEALEREKEPEVILDLENCLQKFT